jgi:hypothetical protein
MKLLRLALIVTAMAALAAAQGAGGMGGGSDMGSMGGGSGGGKKGGGGGGDMGASMGMQSHVSRLDRMTEILKLNKDEKKSIKTILDDGEKQAGPLREEMAKTRTAIAEAIAAGKPQPDIDAAVKAYAAVGAQMTNLELTSFAKIYNGLERDQQNKAGAVLQMMAGIYKTKNWNE